ncbi:MAG: hypothetical protein KAY65_17325 [Planctomycetes bacterium]|nr:hypothetical protein [Planctomycetota bacterium]
MAGGLYRPDQGSGQTPGDRSATFQLKDGVTIRGGYGSGGRGTRPRDIELYETILSGDLDSNDVQVTSAHDLRNEPTRRENSLKVVAGSGTGATTVLDGFTITGGKGHYGGGMSSGDGMTVVNCTFRGNRATYGGGMSGVGTVVDCTFIWNLAGGGGGIFNDGGSLSVTNCTFIGNHADGSTGGGGIFNRGGSPSVTNCTFIGNGAGDRYGGGMANRGASPSITNCTFIGNHGWWGGGGMGNDEGSYPTVTNCIFWGNINTGGVGPRLSQIVNRDSGSTTVTYSDVQGGWPGQGNIDADPCFVDPDGPDNIADNKDDNLRLLPDSLCIDAGDNSAVPPSVTVDPDGNPRIQHGVVDMGAYEYEFQVARTFHVDAVSGRDDNYGLCKERAFATIQKGIDMAEDGSTVLVWPGVYVERVSFDGKAITVRSADYPAVIEAPWQDAVSFIAGGPDSVLQNFVIRDSATAVACNNESSPTLKNLTIVDNDFGIAAYESAAPYISNCILWNNRDGDLFGDGTAYSWVEQNVGIDPLFADLDGGDYHLLSEKGRYVPAHGLWSFDEQTSPCVDGGDPADGPFGERMPNGGRINIGAYGGTPYASMSEWPLSHDKNKDGRMDFRDLASFCDEWLLELRWVAPQDLAWVIEPYALSWSSVTMEAIAEDASGVEYLFRNTTLAYDSGWQDEPDWVDTGLDPYTVYCYALEVRDKSPAQNWRMLSGETCVRTPLPPETTPPEPAPIWNPNDPYQWPTEIYIGPSPTLGWGFEMTCTVATDASGVVEYWFECYDAPSYNSAWITANTWTTPAMGIQGLNLGFRVKARDAYRNETAWSEVKRPSDAPLRDTTPPTPDPATWSVEPYALSSTLIHMEAIAAVDDSGVEYYFENTTIGGHVSGWQDSRNWTDTALSQDTEYCYRVKTRDKSPNANETAWSNTACATTQSGSVR